MKTLNLHPEGHVTSVTWASGPRSAIVRALAVHRAMTVKPRRGTISMRKQKGFSLIELLIVVAIILIIAAIAIPNLLRARIAANESSAAASTRTIATAELSYATAYPTVGYPATLAILGPLDAACTVGPTVTNACIIDFVLGSAGVTPKSGYKFI